MAMMEFLILFSMFATLIKAQPGFISIDCGIPEGSNYTDEETGIFYTSDTGYVETGINKELSSQFNSSNISRQYMNMRSFPDGNRNCYTLQPLVKGNKYLVRASFMYGHYSRGDLLPEFDLYLGVNLWTRFMAVNATKQPWWTEIITVARRDYLFVCLLRKSGMGDPFISSLELRPLDMELYNVTSLEQALVLYKRIDAGSASGRIVRYKDDRFDRIWEPGTTEDQTALNTSLPIKHLFKISQPPSSVISTAVSLADNGSYIYFNWTAEDLKAEYYIIWHFAEVEKLDAGQVREFTVCADDTICYRNFRPQYLVATIMHWGLLSGQSQYNSMLERTSSSTLPPMYNAVEVYSFLRFSQLSTNEQDAEAMMNIKRLYQAKKNWTGDPCAPQTYTWEGVNCSYDGGNSPRIISIDLSTSNLNGPIIPAIGELKALRYLDLSGNNLTGKFPDFLSSIRTISYLNLSGNQLTGSIPSTLLEKLRNGSLQLSVDGNPNLCKSDSCDCLDNSCKKRRKFVVLVAIVVSTIIVAVAITLIVLWNFRKRILKDNGSNNDQNTELLKLGNQQFSYAEIINMTSNFKQMIGKGGFGTVYHGCLRDGRQVAVKILLHNFRGTDEFRTEAKLLMRIHHRNLVSLIGYCFEDPNMALVLEYMSHGNLGKALSENWMIRSWDQRLRIALDIAQGLEYLHIGCKPPIIHRDVKPTNILLNENLEAKIADFGLSKVFFNEDCTHVTTAVKGTLGYLDPEYCTNNNVNEKTDVYSFGIVLLELLTGRSPIIQTTNLLKMSIVEWVSPFTTEDDISKIVDARLGDKFETTSAQKAIALALACTLPKSIQRPSMSNVVQELKDCFRIQNGRLNSSSSNSLNSGQPTPSSPNDSLFFPSAR